MNCSSLLFSLVMVELSEDRPYGDGAKPVWTFFGLHSGFLEAPRKKVEDLAEAWEAYH